MSVKHWLEKYITAGPPDTELPVAVQLGGPVAIPYPNAHAQELAYVHTPISDTQPNLTITRGYEQFRSGPWAEAPGRPGTSTNLPATPGIQAAIPSIAPPQFNVYKITARDRWYAQKGASVRLPRVLRAKTPLMQSSSPTDQSQIIMVTY